MVYYYYYHYYYYYYYSLLLLLLLHPFNGLSSRTTWDLGKPAPER